jgi:hypothetical protein
MERGLEDCPGQGLDQANADVPNNWLTTLTNKTVGKPDRAT